MTSSSTSAATRVSRRADGSGPAEWSWVDLETTSPEAEAERREAERQRLDVEEAYRRGYVEGEESGARMARNELRVAMEATLEALEEVRASREAWEARLHERLVVLAAAMAQKVVDEAHLQDPAPFIELARKAVAAFPVEEPVRIRLNPRDQAVLENGGFMESVVGARAVRWIPDEGVLPGGCIVEGPDKIVDGRVDEALARVVRALTYG